MTCRWPYKVPNWVCNISQTSIFTPVLSLLLHNCYFLETKLRLNWVFSLCALIICRRERSAEWSAHFVHYCYGHEKNYKMELTFESCFYFSKLRNLQIQFWRMEEVLTISIGNITEFSRVGLLLRVPITYSGIKQDPAMTKSVPFFNRHNPKHCIGWYLREFFSLSEIATINRATKSHWEAVLSAESAAAKPIATIP